MINENKCIFCLKITILVFILFYSKNICVYGYYDSFDVMLIVTFIIKNLYLRDLLINMNVNAISVEVNFKIKL